MDVPRVQSHIASVAAHVECCVVIITRQAVCSTPFSAAALSFYHQHTLGQLLLLGVVVAMVQFGDELAAVPTAVCDVI